VVWVPPLLGVVVWVPPLVGVGVVVLDGVEVVVGAVVVVVPAPAGGAIVPGVC
jgi:hypothetical protein